MINKDGSYGSRATQRELAEFYGNDVANQIIDVSDVHRDRWDWFQGHVYQQATIAAHHGRKSLRQR